MGGIDTSIKFLRVGSACSLTRAVEGLGVEVRGWGLRFRVQGSGFRVQGLFFASLVSVLPCVAQLRHVHALLLMMMQRHLHSASSTRMMQRQQRDVVHALMMMVHGAWCMVHALMMMMFVGTQTVHALSSSSSIYWHSNLESFPFVSSRECLRTHDDDDVYWH